MTFSEALDFLKDGYKVRRSGWNGKDQYLEIGTAISYTTANGTIMYASNADIGSKAIVFNGTRGTQVGWLASQSDMLAEDWEIVGAKHG